MTRFIDAALLAAVSADARSRQRLRANFNFHPADDFSHRLLNAIEPGSWLPPPPPRPREGRVDRRRRRGPGVVIFDDAGTVVTSRQLAPAGTAAVSIFPWYLAHGRRPVVRDGDLRGQGGALSAALCGGTGALGAGRGAPEAADYALSLRQLFSSADFPVVK